MDAGQRLTLLPATPSWQAVRSMSALAGHSFRVGIDENGLGPRLGPLVVTAAMARVAPGAERELGLGHRHRADDLGDRLGDSKGLVAHGDVALGEAWARAVVERGAGRAVVAGGSSDEVLQALLLDEPAVLRAPCPAGLDVQCWGTESDRALHGAGGRPKRSGDRSGDGHGHAHDQVHDRAEGHGQGHQSVHGRVASHLERVRADLDGLASRGVELVVVRSVVVCTRRLNDELRVGRSRLVVDLHSMERLLLAMRERSRADLSAVCGKVGGYQDYRPVFGPLGGRLHIVVEQLRARSAYRFPGLGEIAFVQDADESDLLVGLASLVGKWVRELLMHRIVHHYRRLEPELPDASGYNDPVTVAFVDRSAPLRHERQVPDDCFERLRSRDIDDGDAVPKSRRPG
jgi:hypothetical protein